MTEIRDKITRLNIYGWIIVASLVAALGVSVLTGFGSVPASLVALAVVTLYIAMRRNRSESCSDNDGSERDDSEGRIEGKAMVGPAEGDL